jgi:hypothetical protein
MSETVPQDNQVELASAAASALAPTAAPDVPTAVPIAASAPMQALPFAVPSETREIIELIAHGLAPNADDVTRSIARELWARFAQVIAAASVPTSAPVPAAPFLPAIPAASAAPVAPAVHGSPAAPVLPVAAVLPALAPAPTMAGMPMLPPLPAPTSPIAMAARALRQLPPDQLLDVVLQRLRTVLPAGANVPAAKGIQFQLVPVTPPSGSR